VRSITLIVNRRIPRRTNQNGCQKSFSHGDERRAMNATLVAGVNGAAACLGAPFLNRLQCCLLLLAVVVRSTAGTPARRSIRRTPFPQHAPRVRAMTEVYPLERALKPMTA